MGGKASKRRGIAARQLVASGELAGSDTLPSRMEESSEGCSSSGLPFRRGRLRYGKWIPPITYRRLNPPVRRSTRPRLLARATVPRYAVRALHGVHHTTVHGSKCVPAKSRDSTEHLFSRGPDLCLCCVQMSAVDCTADRSQPGPSAKQDSRVLTYRECGFTVTSRHLTSCHGLGCNAISWHDMSTCPARNSQGVAINLDRMEAVNMLPAQLLGAELHFQSTCPSSVPTHVHSIDRSISTRRIATPQQGIS